MRFSRRGDRRRPARQALSVRAGVSSRPPTWIRVWPLMIAGLAVQLGAAAGNPWGLGDDDPQLGAAGGSGDVSYPGAVVRQAPDTDWKDDAEGGWGQRQRLEDGHDPGFQFRSDPEDGRVGAGYSVGPDDAADTGYRFRGDPPNAGGGWKTQAPDGRYQFRPLSEQERGRQEQSQGWRPAPAGRGQGRSPGPPPDGSADTAPGWEPPWQSR